MDFAIPYTPEQDRFREEVKAWIGENVPEDMKEPIDGREFTEEQFRFWKGKHRELAAKGWLYPTQPKEYGGGGLTGDHETIILEEFHKARVVRAFSGFLVIPPLLVWGTEEQKQKFLVPFLKAEKATWQRLTEPQSGADLANVQEPSKTATTGSFQGRTCSSVAALGRDGHLRAQISSTAWR